MTTDDPARRSRALAEALERFPAVHSRMRDTFGLILPRHLAVWAAFWHSLSPIERKGMDHIGCSPGGIMTWFEPGGLEREMQDGLDVRLVTRFRCDPPEFVTVMWGNTDGLHYGAWYDDPASPPTTIASNYARDSAETGADEPTVLATLSALADRFIDEPDYPDEPAPESVHAVRAALAWFEPHDDEALNADGDVPWRKAKRGAIVGGFGPALPANAGDTRSIYKASEQRGRAYRSEPERVDAWIATARNELASGKPAFALVLGRELHWCDDVKRREVALELLTAAYTKLGREALAEIARVHYAHRDLSSVAGFR